ncbi:actin-associated protein FAM107A [Bacillus rossius redtenbacheri]|uniref:actin-associated protein FAM107A n=1 Tax=Bacillus rossius redtenbacheri TaxID=93214 RepID=UPI002FDED8D4
MERQLIPRARLRRSRSAATPQSRPQLQAQDANCALLYELRSRVAGAVFPAMIPEPDACAPGGDLEKRNRRNTGAAPAAPPLPPFSPEGLILPRKPANPCLESSDHKNLHRELLFNHRIGKNVLNQKSELQKALEKHKELQLKKELQQQQESSKSVLERVIEERAKRLEMLQKPEGEAKSPNGAPEFLQVHAKLRARMDSK